MSDLMVCDACIAWVVAQWLSAEDFGSGEDFWRYYRKLVWGIECMGLRIGVVMDSVEAKLDKAGISKAFTLISDAIHSVTTHHLLCHLKAPISSANSHASRTSSTSNGLIGNNTVISNLEQLFCA